MGTSISSRMAVKICINYITLPPPAVTNLAQIRTKYALVLDISSQKSQAQSHASPTRNLKRGGQEPESATSPIDSIAAMAAASSLSDISPEMPTAPKIAPSELRIKTPPGTGIKSPSIIRPTASTK